MNSTFWFFIGISVLIAIYHLIKDIEKYIDYNHPMYRHSTKCFSCERDIASRYGMDWAWMGQDTKSFDSEVDMIQQTGNIISAYNTHDIRYY